MSHHLSEFIIKFIFGRFFFVYVPLSMTPSARKRTRRERKAAPTEGPAQVCSHSTRRRRKWVLVRFEDFQRDYSVFFGPRQPLAVFLPSSSSPLSSSTEEDEGWGSACASSCKYLQHCRHPRHPPALAYCCCRVLECCLQRKSLFNSLGEKHWADGERKKCDGCGTRRRCSRFIPAIRKDFLISCSFLYSVVDCNSLGVFCSGFFVLFIGGNLFWYLKAFLCNTV